MNTDKLLELERKWREEAEKHDFAASEADSVGLTDAAECGRLFALVKIQLADELAAALRAEQAAGEEQPDEWAEATKISTHDDVDDVLRDFAADPTGDNGVMVVREVMRVLRALGTARQSEGVVPEGVYAPRYVADGPEGMFGTDDLELAGKLIARGADDPDEWTVTDLTETGIEANKEAAAPGGEGEG